MDSVLNLFKLEICTAVSVPPGYYFKYKGNRWLFTVSDSQSWTVLDEIDAKAFIDSEYTGAIFTVIPRRYKQVKDIIDLFDML